MARSLPAGYNAALTTNPIRIGVLVDIHWANTVTYVWSGYGDMVYEGNTYLGVGQLGSISTVSESGSIQADGIEIGLTGIPASMVSTVLTEARQGKTVSIHQALFDEDWALIDVYENVFKGILDVPVINKSAKNASIVVKAENRLIELQKTRVRRYTDQDQKDMYPNDPGLEFVAGLQDVEIRWGLDER